MTLVNLIRKREAGKPANDNLAKVANDGLARERPLAGLAALALARSYNAANNAGDSDDSLPDPAAEARRQRVLAMLAERPEIRYAALTDSKTDSEAVLFTLAIRGKATCELRIPREKYDGVLLLDLIERHGGTVH